MLLLPRIMNSSSSSLFRRQRSWWCCTHCCCRTNLPIVTTTSSKPLLLQDQKRRFVTTPVGWKSSSSSSSPFDTKNLNVKPISNSTITKRKKRRLFVPRVAAVQLTDQAREFFKQLLRNPIRTDIIGIMLNYDQSISGEPRMVFKFTFVTNNEIDHEQDEGVSLELIPASSSSSTTTTNENVVDGTANETVTMIPKPPMDSRNDGLPKLYVHRNAFLKVLGATIDVDIETITPILYDREGNRMDPNA